MNGTTRVEKLDGASAKQWRELAGRTVEGRLVRHEARRELLEDRLPHRSRSTVHRLRSLRRSPPVRAEPFASR